MQKQSDFAKSVSTPYHQKPLIEKSSKKCITRIFRVQIGLQNWLSIADADFRFTLGVTAGAVTKPLKALVR